MSNQRPMFRNRELQSESITSQLDLLGQTHGEQQRIAQSIDWEQGGLLASKQMFAEGKIKEIRSNEPFS